ncbi:MAG: hypothetical protein K9I82_04015 [Chitinophagaceae bacterium]|nr:hypothetical protein [Chitinophagaceae bacterium]
MAIGVYGTIRPSDVSPEDVEIIMIYSPTRNKTENIVQKKLSATTLLKPYFDSANTQELLGGLYNLTLPATEFSSIGFYTIYLRPAQIRTKISDCGVLSALPNVKGIVINLDEVPVNFRNKFEKTQELVGYRVEYINKGQKVPNFFRVVTSSFFCEPIVTNETNTSQKSIRYRYVENNTNLVFLTLSPSNSPSNKTNAVPFIGQPGQSIIITNTYFNPTTLEVEIAEHDISTLAVGIFGNQTKSVEDGIYTIYDSENNIFKQYNLFEVRNQFNELLYEVREDRGNDIDVSKNFDNIIE